VEERRPVRLTADFRSIEARNAIRGYLKSQSVQSSQRGALEGILKHAAQLATLDDQERRLTREQRELERSTDETRSSLKAIQKNNQAESLRRELTERLARGTRRLDEITKELIELRLRRTEQEVRLKEVILGLEIPPPDRRSANPSPE
jgi:predicted transcriptional regulator